MGLDIYAGTLTRYFCQNWKTAVQQWAEENGFTFSRIAPDGAAIEKEPLDPVLVQADMEGWRDALLAAISSKDAPYSPWPEDNLRPYYTDKPDWDAMGALLIHSASVLYGEPCPETVEKGWNFYEHPLVKRLLDDPEKNWSLFIATEMWLPIPDCFSLVCQTPNGEEKTVATTGSLLAELGRLNDLSWKADPALWLRWGETEGYPADAAPVEGEIVAVEENTAYNTQSLAKFAFSILYRAACFSMENRVPILLDY